MLDEMLKSSLMLMKHELASLIGFLKTEELTNVFVKDAIIKRMDELRIEITYLETRVH